MYPARGAGVITRCGRARSARDFAFRNVWLTLRAMKYPVWLALLPLAATACVRVEAYDEAIYNMRAARAEAEQRGAQANAFAAEVARLQAEVARLGREREALAGEVTLSRANTQKRVDDLMALNSELSQRLKAAGQSAETLAGERGALAKALADTRARLEELRKREAAAEARAAQVRDLSARLDKLVAAGHLKVVVREGRLLIELGSDVLFDSGKIDLKDDGRRTLVEVARALRSLGDRRFQVAGHTDNVKIATARFPSNWELSTARAIEVLKLLAGPGGMDEKALSAAGYGEFAPVASNESPEGRGRNRRIEIALVPKLDELLPAAAPAPR